MRTFVLFTTASQLYGIDIEAVKRILPVQNLTDIPDEPEHIEGMFQYEDEVLKVLSFRKMIGQKPIQSKQVENQRCLILTNEETSSETETKVMSFGVNIDKVEDIIHVPDESLHLSENRQDLGEYMSIEAILEYENKLVTIVKDISLNKAV